VLFFTRLIAIRTDPPLVTRSVSCDPPDTLQIDGPAPIPCVGKLRLSRLNLRLFHFEPGYIRSFFFVLHFLLFVLHFHLRIPVLCSLCDPGWPEEAAHNPQYHGVCAQGHRRIRIRERSTLFYIGESRKSAHQGAGTCPLLFEMPVYVLVYRLIFLLAICFGLFLDLFFLLAICLLYVFFLGCYSSRCMVCFVGFRSFVTPLVLSPAANIRTLQGLLLFTLAQPCALIARTLFAKRERS
jgi:hypothetical protein